MMGGDFGQGAFQGAWTSAFAMICNDWLEKEFPFLKEQRLQKEAAELKLKRLRLENNFNLAKIDDNAYMLIPQMDPINDFIVNHKSGPFNWNIIEAGASITSTGMTYIGFSEGAGPGAPVLIFVGTTKIITGLGTIGYGLGLRSKPRYNFIKFRDVPDDIIRALPY